MKLMKFAILSFIFILVSCTDKEIELKYIFHLKGVRPIREIDLLHRWPDDDTHDWGHEETYTKPGADICNWLIHSYIFFFPMMRMVQLTAFMFLLTMTEIKCFTELS